MSMVANGKCPDPLHPSCLRRVPARHLLQRRQMHPRSLHTHLCSSWRPMVEAAGVSCPSIRGTSRGERGEVIRVSVLTIWSGRSHPHRRGRRCRLPPPPILERKEAPPALGDGICLLRSSSVVSSVHGEIAKLSPFFNGGTLCS